MTRPRRPRLRLARDRGSWLALAALLALAAVGQLFDSVWDFERQVLALLDWLSGGG